jgi:hypothetical protein
MNQVANLFLPRRIKSEECVLKENHFHALQ